MTRHRRFRCPCRRLATIAGLAGLLTLGGCSETPPEPVPAGLPDAARREQLRERIREQLGPGYDQAIAEASTEQLQRGAKVYDLLCASCHGRTGKGNGRSARMLEVRPPDLSDARQAAFFSDRAKLHIIAEGLEGTPMIGWKQMLSEQELLDVLQFLRSLSARAQTPEPTS